MIVIATLQIYHVQTFFYNYHVRFAFSVGDTTRRRAVYNQYRIELMTLYTISSEQQPLCILFPQCNHIKAYNYMITPKLACRTDPITLLNNVGPHKTTIRC